MHFQLKNIIHYNTKYKFKYSNNTKYKFEYYICWFAFLRYLWYKFLRFFTFSNRFKLVQKEGGGHLNVHFLKSPMAGWEFIYSYSNP